MSSVQVFLQVKDQIGNEISFSDYPQRIVSTVPSQSELLFYLGLDDQIAGITQFCIHPREKWKKKVKIGGTKKLNLDRIRMLNPDLIIANKEENQKEQIEELQKEYPVWVSDIITLNEAFSMMETVGLITGKSFEANQLVLNIQNSFENIKIRQPTSALYLIWKQPYMAAGSDTFINSMMESAGFVNICANQGRYPTVSIEAMKELEPKIILLSSEPYPFKQKHVEDLQKVLPNCKIILADGELFSWYGPRMAKFPAYIESLLSII